MIGTDPKETRSKVGVVSLGNPDGGENLIQNVGMHEELLERLCWT